MNGRNIPFPNVFGFLLYIFIYNYYLLLLQNYFIFYFIWFLLFYRQFPSVLSQSDLLPATTNFKQLPRKCFLFLDVCSTFLLFAFCLFGQCSVLEFLRCSRIWAREGVNNWGFCEQRACLARWQQRFLLLRYAHEAERNGYKWSEKICARTYARV